MTDKVSKVFVSHSSADDDVITRLHDEIETAAPELEIWVDHRDIGDGEVWQSEIDKALQECELMIVALSMNSYNDVEVMAEWRRAFRLDHKVFSVIIDDIEERKIPSRLAVAQCTYLRPEDDWKVNLPRLINALRGERGEDLPSPVPDTHVREKNRVFISYRREDVNDALHISSQLASLGLDTFLDVRHLDSGLYSDRIFDEIGKRECFLLLITPRLLSEIGETHDFIRKEIKRALRKQRVIVPVYFSPEDLRMAKEKFPPYLRPALDYNGMLLPRVNPDQVVWFQAMMKELVADFLSRSPTEVYHPDLSRFEEFNADITNVKLQRVEIAKHNEKILREKEKTQEIVRVQVDDEKYATAQRQYQLGLEAEDPEEKIRKFTKAIELYPELLQAYLHRATVYMNQQDYDRAESDLNALLAAQPDNWKARLDLGYLHFKRDQYKDALEHYDAIVMRLEHESIAAHQVFKLRAMLHIKHQNWSLAIQDLTEYLQYYDDKNAEDDLRTMRKMLNLP